MAKISILKILRLLTWEFWENFHLGVASMENKKGYYKERMWWLPPSLGHGESCESVCAYDLFVHQMCSNYALTNLLFGLYKSIWIIDPLVICLSPHLEAPAQPSYLLKCCELGSVPNSFFCYPLWDLHLNLLRVIYKQNYIVYQRTTHDNILCSWHQNKWSKWRCSHIIVEANVASCAITNL